MSPLPNKQFLYGLIRPARHSIEVTRFAASSRVMHWLVAVLVFATWPLGLAIGLASKEASLSLYMLHESLGFLILWLMLLRVGNSLMAAAPQSEGSALERVAAGLVHRLLYFFLIVMPVSGFLATNAHGFPLQWFGLMPVWSPLGKNPELAWFLSGVHFWSAWILFALVAMHLGAVLFHHVVRKDPTLYRML